MQGLPDGSLELWPRSHGEAGDLAKKACSWASSIPTSRILGGAPRKCVVCNFTLCPRQQHPWDLFQTPAPTPSESTVLQGLQVIRLHINYLEALV